MIVKSQTTGGEVNNVCRLSFALPSPSSGKRFALVRTKLPRLPFRFSRQNQLNSDGVNYSLPDARSLPHLAELLSALTDGGGDQVVSCFYSGNEFELCVGSNDVLLEATLASALGLQTNLLTGVCYEATVEEEHMNESDYYRVTVQSMDVTGFFEDGVRTQIVEEFRQDEELPATQFVANGNTTAFGVKVEAVRKDGEVVELAVADAEVIGMWFKVT